MKNINPRILLAIILLPLAIVIAAVPAEVTENQTIPADALLGKFTDGMQYISTDQVADWIVQKDPSYLLIDVRDENAYNEYHFPGSINIPLHSILNEDYRPYLNQDIRLNVFYSNGTVKANEAWMLCTQMGFKNNYVMQGGLNYWAETILSPEEPSKTNPSDEFAKYDFRSAVNQALGGGSLKPKEQKSTPALPQIKVNKKKKKASGGC